MEPSGSTPSWTTFGVPHITLHLTLYVQEVSAYSELLSPTSIFIYVLKYLAVRACSTTEGTINPKSNVNHLGTVLLKHLRKL